MKRTIIFVSIVLMALTAQGQRIHAYVTAGGTLSQIEGDELKGFRLLGYTAGVGAITNFDKKGRWNISLEALFARRGSYNASGDPYSLSLPLNYIDIPLMVHFRDPWGGMLIGLGVNYGRLVQQPTGAILYNPSYFVPDTTDMTFRSSDWAVVADIRFPIWRGLMLNLRWQYSFVAVKRDWQFTEYLHNGTQVSTWHNDCYNNTLAFRLIWQF